MFGKVVFKWSLVAFNILFVIVGGVALTLGLVLKFKTATFAEYFNQLVEGAGGASQLEGAEIPALLESCTWAIIVCGAFIFLVGFFGCCGAWKELRLFLFIYAIILSLIVVVQLAVVGMAYVMSEDVEDELLGLMSDSMKMYTEGANYNGTALELHEENIGAFLWDMLQVKMECCGASNYTDWEMMGDLQWESNGGMVPVSCCKMVDSQYFYPVDNEHLEFLDQTQCLNSAAEESTNTEGCYKTIYDFIMKYELAAMLVGLGTLLIEIFGIVFACCLCKIISKEGDYKSI